MDYEMDIDGGDSFVQATEAFLNWFKSLPGATFHDDIRIEDLRGKNAGRGIVATRDIEPDTILFTIPRQAIISTSTSPLPQKLPHIFSEDSNDNDAASSSSSSSSSSLQSGQGQDSWTSLILLLMYEHFRSQESPFKPYLDILPSAFNTPMFWSPAELAELQASSLVSKIGKHEADRMLTSKILPVIRANPDIFVTSASDAELLELAHRMGSAIMAYAFDMEKDDEPSQNGEEEDDEWIEDRDGRTQMGMVPMADMLNADAEFNAFINHGTESLTAVSLRKIKAGEEILNYYGPLASSELLRRYGYVTSKHARYDVVELPWTLVEQRLKDRFAVALRGDQAVWEKITKKVTEEAEDEWQDSLVLERTAPDPDSCGQFQGDAVFNSLPEELEEQVKLFLKGVKKALVSTGDKGGGVSEAALADKDTRNEIYLDSVLRALKDREGQYYGTTLEEDEQLVGNMRDGRPNTRNEMAVWVRRGEKQLLREAQGWVEGRLGEVRDKMSSRAPAGGDEPSAKRRRG
ncbi:hypothetical protein B0H66DRAFT_511145 [Apodospora peruviana]|uniref:SET domain-containing protein n=1 Tax=Apodospora peruviana TaxID=516989 RepID=A0AAE0IHN2_9PEZI|nr:hypothetical protein B0H66DRAFT_511145 [Apodospora peruviana]